MKQSDDMPSAVSPEDNGVSSGIENRLFEHEFGIQPTQTLNRHQTKPTVREISRKERYSILIYGEINSTLVNFTRRKPPHWYY